TVLSAYLLVRTLEDNLKFNRLTFFIVLSILSLPYTLRWGNFLLSQGLAYPLFLLTVRYLFISLFKGNKKALYYGMVTLILLTLTRRQFLFMYVVFPCVILYIGYRYKLILKEIMFLLLMFGLTYLSADFLERSYNFFYHKPFSTVPSLGMQLIVAPLYLASEEDEVIFEDNQEKR